MSADVAKTVRQPKLGSKEAALRDLRKQGKTPRHVDVMLDDGAPPEIIRLPGHKSKPVETEAPPAVKLSARQIEKKAIEREAAQRWRDWTPTAEHLQRPRQSTFRQLVRAERKAAAEAATKAAKAAQPKAAKGAADPEETTMASRRKKSNGKNAARSKARSGGKSKVDLIASMLKRDNGCTTADVLKVTNWPAVSMPAQAKAAGLKLKKEKKPGEPTRYYGT